MDRQGLSSGGGCPGETQRIQSHRGRSESMAQGKQRTHVVSIDEHASDFDEGVEKARLRRIFPWSLQQVVLGVRMRIKRERTDEPVRRDETLEGSVLGFFDCATEDNEQINVTGVGGAVMTDSCTIAVASAEVVAADARGERH